MQVILMEKVANLGNIGDRVKVRSGYGRNYLLPTARATLATPDNIKKFEARRAELERLANEHLASAQTRAAAFKDFRLAITAKAGENGLILLSCGVNANTLRFLMPLTAEDKIINEGFDILEKTIGQAIEGAAKVA